MTENMTDLLTLDLTAELDFAIRTAREAATIVNTFYIGSAEVRKIFGLSKGGNVAGCVVSSGRIVKGKMRVMRRKGLIYEGVSLTLRRFQDEVNEVRAGMECGIRLDGFDDFQIGDAIECYTLEKVPQKL